MFSKKNGKDQFCHQIGAPRITTDITVKYYTEELKLLADSLGKLSGTPVTDASLKAAAEKYNEIRTLIAQLNELRRQTSPLFPAPKHLLS
jgi:benzoyl-CoA reductase/2-hydroxyglutaryl-CoA dehydratase subunit BcrC/BadD/HgdB